MSLRSFYTLLLQTSVLTLTCLLLLSVSFAQVRESSSYRLESDSINFGGGLSTSTNYSLESTAGEVATGDSDSTSYSLRAGYQQMQEVFLSITPAANVTLLPAIGGLTGGISNGSTSVVVLTDSPSGYELVIAAESAPAMQNSPYTIADYATAGPAADFAFLTDDSDAHFGFTPEGSDVVAAFLDDGDNCGVGGFETSLSCWRGLSTTDILIAQGLANQPAGATTTLNFRVGVGATAGVIMGTYIATTTLTAVPL